MKSMLVNQEVLLPEVITGPAGRRAFRKHETSALPRTPGASSLDRLCTFGSKVRQFCLLGAIWSPSATIDSSF